jgi:hypothetical protein
MKIYRPTLLKISTVVMKQIFKKLMEYLGSNNSLNVEQPESSEAILKPTDNLLSRFVNLMVLVYHNLPKQVLITKRRCIKNNQVY